MSLIRVPSDRTNLLNDTRSAGGASHPAFKWKIIKCHRIARRPRSRARRNAIFRVTVIFHGGCFSPSFLHSILHGSGYFLSGFPNCSLISSRNSLLSKIAAASRNARRGFVAFLFVHGNIRISIPILDTD